MENNELRKDVSDKLQLALTVSIFFPSILYIFLDNGGMAKMELSQISSTWAFITGVYLICYLIFSEIKNNFPDRFLRWAKALFVMSLVSYIFPILVLATSAREDKPASTFVYYLLKFSLFLLPILPLLTLLLLVFVSIKLVIKNKC